MLFIYGISLDFYSLHCGINFKIFSLIIIMTFAVQCVTRFEFECKTD